MQQVSSRNIRSVGYDAEALIMAVEFHSCGIYQYSNVSETVHHGLMQASSEGSYFRRFIRNQYSFGRLR